MATKEGHQSCGSGNGETWGPCGSDRPERSVVGLSSSSDWGLSEGGYADCLEEEAIGESAVSGINPVIFARLQRGETTVRHTQAAVIRDMNEPDGASRSLV